jgi:hypothetical protein
MNNPKEKELLPDTPHKRIKFLRKNLNVTIQDFSNLKTEIRVSTLGKIEANLLKVSPKFAAAFARFSTASGLVCTPEWILEGKAPYPFRRSENLLSETYSDINILEEILAMKKLYHEFHVSPVKDSSMLPNFSPGDYVGGSPIDKTAIVNFHLAHLIYLKNDVQLFRVVDSIKDNKIILKALNEGFPQHEEANLENIHIICPITWHHIFLPKSVS